MRLPVIHLIEVITGGVLIILGLIYLSAQAQVTDRMTAVVYKTLMEDENIYQQELGRNIDLITDEQLISIMMGYREYAIMIDGVTIPADNHDPEAYLALIKAGNYTKSYQCDINNDIVTISYIFVGVT